MIFHDVGLPGAKRVELRPFRDDRGAFARTWCRETFANVGIDIGIAQGNASHNPRRGTMRGLHWQAAPHGEGKLVRCVRGAVYDVIVDIDPDSSTYLRWYGLELTPGSGMLYVPPACAHGFLTLADDTEVDYLVSAPYAPGWARGLRYDDPALAIAWPIPVTVISEQDRAWPLLAPPARRAVG